jgi:hypothetical protein
MEAVVMAVSFCFYHLYYYKAPTSLISRKVLAVVGAFLNCTNMKTILTIGFGILIAAGIQNEAYFSIIIGIAGLILIHTKPKT